ncbi:MAG: hypothetical protein HZB42_06865 [Sphingobacteriales bacterium]|nr:hypothetical protein [Sphingobacteriales bacterium]
MAYQVYILRKKDYSNESEKSNITLKEWIEYGISDQELEPAVEYSVDNPNLSMEQAEEINKALFGENDTTGSFEWFGHPRSDADTIPCFHFYHDSIMAKYPDNHTIGKMIRIASILSAKVQGDDGEYYDETFFSNGGYPAEG